VYYDGKMVRNRSLLILSNYLSMVSQVYSKLATGQMPDVLTLVKVFPVRILVMDGVDY